MDSLSIQLDDLRQRGLYRSLREPTGVPLSSNDYLGLSRSPEITAALVDALQEGVDHGSTGSRLLTGHRGRFDRLESDFARWQNRPAALFFATGYSANVGLLSSILGPDDVVVSDSLNHASLIDGIRLGRAERCIVPHLDIQAVEEAVRTPRTGQCYVVVESVYSMDGDLADLNRLNTLCAEHGAHLIVDEAHATGLFGPRGAGRITDLGIEDAIFASIHTCGKALGQSGAFICGSDALRQTLINRARSFIYSTAPPPFLAAGLAKAIELVQADPERRQKPLRLAQQLRNRLKDSVSIGSSESHIVPLIVHTANASIALAEMLRGLGWDVYPIRPPTVPEGECRIRLVMNASLEPHQIDKLADDILTGCNELEL
ncbi:MAG: 8-amino-7-oxononanoate synthase [Myxococcales bacterium]|nr:8-amino-7-oxononanoate synthase [Myxococcales bacterium]|tara:strand:+ start:324 stop:1445 length:1122 start_codon:yes stop_codon:yes gene_type:complete